MKAFENEDGYRCPATSPLIEALTEDFCAYVSRFELIFVILLFHGIFFLFFSTSLKQGTN